MFVTGGAVDPILVFDPIMLALWSIYRKILLSVRLLNVVANLAEIIGQVMALFITVRRGVCSGRPGKTLEPHLSSGRSQKCKTFVSIFTTLTSRY